MLIYMGRLFPLWIRNASASALPRAPPSFQLAEVFTGVVFRDGWAERHYLNMDEFHE